MKSRKDQVQAYFFVVGRLAAAVTHGNPEALQAPGRRMVTGTIFGFLIAVLLAAVFGILGLFVPGTDTSWRQAGNLVMDKDTGARYVYLDDQLRPVLNYSSARLLAPRSGGKMSSVSASSLSGTPVGQPVGIASAPDALPAAADLDAGAWTVCVQPAGDGNSAPVVSLLIGRPAEGTMTDRQAFLVSGPDGTGYLVWNGTRLRVPDPVVLASLGYGGIRPAPVSTAWLNPIPQGPDLTVPSIDGIGRPGPVIGGRQSIVGQIYEVKNAALGTSQMYLVREDGVVALDRTVAALLLSAPATARAYPGAAVEPVEVGVAATAGIPSPATNLGAGLPAEPPEIVSGRDDVQPCVRFGTSGEPEEELVPSATVQRISVPAAPHQAGTAADRVSVPAGKGALVAPKSAPGAVPGPTSLVTDVGMRYPIAGPDVLDAFGYGNVAVTTVSPELLALFPAGPLLSTAAASGTGA
ncbi:type VII secretion protein EccB [Amycolatopsis sp. WQ 127309]|uniref:type VII secretion protein EccB n=1 Tax=Amycolatopsis sp. WQ 127309 TaxID=2932773 RepID=UPI001FF17936|nr:type VII secretion protein EccB [Amycolatopsis sp. WQ 127309]UOZ06919.1 type VII secretion protein EccB [Amycolatopsis sp. WQ 127309]